MFPLNCKFFVLGCVERTDADMLTGRPTVDWDFPAECVLRKVNEARSQRAAGQVIDELTCILARINNVG